MGTAASDLQLVTDTGSQVIVGVAVTNRGSDLAEAAPMHQQVIERTDDLPKEYLIDGGFTVSVKLASHVRPV